MRLKTCRYLLMTHLQHVNNLRQRWVFTAGMSANARGMIVVFFCWVRDGCEKPNLLPFKANTAKQSPGAGSGGDSSIPVPKKQLTKQKEGGERQHQQYYDWLWWASIVCDKQGGVIIHCFFFFYSVRRGGDCRRMMRRENYWEERCSKTKTIWLVKERRTDPHEKKKKDKIKVRDEKLDWQKKQPRRTCRRGKPKSGKPWRVGNDRWVDEREIRE